MKVLDSRSYFYRISHHLGSTALTPQIKNIMIKNIYFISEGEMQLEFIGNT